MKCASIHCSWCVCLSFERLKNILDKVLKNLFEKKVEQMFFEKSLQQIFLKKVCNKCFRKKFATNICLFFGQTYFGVVWCVFKNY